MVRVFIDFGSYVKYALIRDMSIIQYCTFDYDEDTLSRLYALMKSKGVQELNVCIPSSFSDSVLVDSTSLGITSVADRNGFFCVSVEDIQKLQQLADSLSISNVRYTERCFMCRSDGVFLFELNNIYHIMTVHDSRIVQYDMQTEALVESTVQDRCLRYGCKSIYNYVNASDVIGLSETFDNIFSVSSDKVLSDLTYIMLMLDAEYHSAHDYLFSRYANQHLVGNTESLVVDSANDFDSRAFANDADVCADMTSEDRQPKVRNERKVVQVADDNKKHAPFWKFGYTLAAVTVILLVLNFGIYYLKLQKSAEYEKIYSQYLEENDALQKAQARNLLFTSQTTTENGSNTYSFLKNIGLDDTKEKGITLQSFSIEGSTIQLNVTAKNDDTFWSFCDTVKSKYNVSDVQEGDIDDKGVSYTINVII